MITVSLGKFTFTISITNWSCKYSMKIPVSYWISFCRKRYYFTAVCSTSTASQNSLLSRNYYKNIIIKKTFLSLLFVSHGTTTETLQKLVICNYILDYIYSKFNQLLSSWNQGILQQNKLVKSLWICWWNSFTNFLSKDKSKHCF